MLGVAQNDQLTAGDSAGRAEPWYLFLPGFEAGNRKQQSR